MMPPAPAYAPPLRSAGAFLSRIRPDRLTLLIAAAALLGVGLTLAREVTYGVALQSDSFAYIRAARDLAAGDGFSRGAGYSFWPPLYPLLLAAAGLGIFDPYAVAGPLNAALFGITIFIVGQYLRRRLPSRFLALWACLALALSIPLAESAANALTGSLFILMITLALIQTDKFLSEGKTSSLLWAAVFSALAWQTRYLGGAVVVFVVLLLLFQSGPSLLQRARRIAGFSLITGLPMALWLLRNYLVSGDLTGHARMLDYDLLGLAGDVFGGLWSWIYSGLPLAPWLPTALAAAVLIPSGYILIKERSKKPNLSLWRSYCIFGGFALVYILLLITALMLVPVGVALRFLTPLYIPLIMVAVLALAGFHNYRRNVKLPVNVGSIPVIKKFARNKMETPGLLSVILTICISLWIVGQIAPNVQEIIRANSSALIYGYSAQPFADSETLRYFRENPITGIVYSNEKLLLRFHKYDATKYRGIPTQVREGNAALQEQLAVWLADVPEGAYIVWLSNLRDNHSFAYTGADMRIAPGFRPVAELPDGFIFQADRGYTPASDPYRAEYDAIVSGGEPAISSIFDIYSNENTLSYIKKSCAGMDTIDPFLLHITPADTADLLADSRQQGFNNLDFHFTEHGVRVAGMCLIKVPLPGYEIARIRTGQFVYKGEMIWENEVNPGIFARFREIEAGLESSQLVESGTFDLYFDGDRMVYYKDACADADTQARFFLHLFPIDADDLPDDRREYGFGNVGFDFSEHGARRGGKCLAVVTLPGYEIARIRTGQYLPGEDRQIWRAEFAPGR